MWLLGNVVLTLVSAVADPVIEHTLYPDPEPSIGATGLVVGGVAVAGGAAALTYCYLENCLDGSAAPEPNEE